MDEEKKVTSKDAINAVETLRLYCSNWRNCNDNCLFYTGDENGECSLINRSPNCWYEDFVLANKEGLLRSKIIEVLVNDYSYNEKVVDKIMDEIKEVYGDKLDD